jgi:hypothetical protein
MDKRWWMNQHGGHLPGHDGAGSVTGNKNAGHCDCEKEEVEVEALDIYTRRELREGEKGKRRNAACVCVYTIATLCCCVSF